MRSRATRDGHHRDCWRALLSRSRRHLGDWIEPFFGDGYRQCAYVIAGSPEEMPDVILIATGSEVSLAVHAYEQLPMRESVPG